MFTDFVKENLDSDNLEKAPTRDGYGSGLLLAGQKNDRVVALCCDLTESTRTHKFAEQFPERFIQIGIAEQNMASVASGMAAMGKIPFIASYAMFSPGRSWEQVRTTIAYNDSNVKIIGAHAGISVGPDGATHQALEDIAIMRVIPNMVVIAPADVYETERAVLAASEYIGPVYIRLGRSATPVVTKPDSDFAIGKSYLAYDCGDDSSFIKKIGLISTGSLLSNALFAAEDMKKHNIGVSVLHLPTIKPLDTEGLLEFSSSHDLLVTLEEHQVAGGLGSVVSEFLSETKPTKIIKIGVKDRFGESGEPDELMSYFGLDVKGIVSTLQKSVGDLN